MNTEGPDPLRKVWAFRQIGGQTVLFACPYLDEYPEDQHVTHAFRVSSPILKFLQSQRSLEKEP